jgi:hypothetical protein
VTFIKSYQLGPVHYRNEMRNVFTASWVLLFELTAFTFDRLKMECGVAINQRTFLRISIHIAVYIFIRLSSVNRIIIALLKIC